MRARFRGERGDHEGAVADLRQAVSVEPEDFRGWRDLGVQLEVRAPDEAEQALSRALALDADDSASWDYRGHTRLLRGDFEAASRDLARACELDPSDAEAWHARGQALVSLARFAEATPLLERAVGLKPSWADPWISLGRARVGLGQLGPAAIALDRALGLAPGDPHALLGRALLRHTEGNLEAARADAEKAAARLPDGDFDLTVARALLRKLGPPAR